MKKFTVKSKNLNFIGFKLKMARMTVLRCYKKIFTQFWKKIICRKGQVFGKDLDWKRGL